jgi:hypothetical protein
MLKLIKDKISRMMPRIHDAKEISPGGIAIGPGWLAKAAFPLLLGIILLCAFITSWIHYPEILKARAVIIRFGNNDSMCLVEIDPPQNNWFRIDSGQTVQLQFDDYQYTRFGYTRGVLGHVFYSKGHSDVQAWLNLPAGLTTNKDKSIPLKPDLKADILITIKDMMLFQRIFYNSPRKSFH